MIDAAEVKAVVQEYVDGKEGYFVVDVTVGGDNTVAVEVDSESGFSIDECVELTRFIESRIDREKEDYELEVGSPGLTSPFKVIEQYHKFEGQEVEVLDKEGKKQTGVLCDVTPDGFAVDITTREKVEGQKRKQLVTRRHQFRYDEVKHTKYSIKFK